MSDDWLGDPFSDPEDPEAAAREERRREREERRRRREAKRGGKKAPAERAAEPPAQAPAAPAPPAPETPAAPAPSAPEPPPPAPEVPPPPPRSPDEEFWDEPAEPPEPAVPEAGLPPELTPAGAGGALPPPSGRRPRAGGDGNRPRGGALAGLRRHPFLAAALVVGFLVFWFVYALFQPFHSGQGEPVQVKIPKGAGVSEVGDLLSREGVIEDPILPIGGSTLFQIRVTLAGKRSSLYAGSFALAEGMSYGDAIDAVTTPPVKRTRTVTIPEGYTRSQAAQLVEEDGVPGDYTDATIRSPYLNPAKYGGKGAKDLEGFLFPNTFELRGKAPVEDLVQLQLEDFKRQIAKVDMRYAKSKNLTVYDVLIIASMIEREAGLPAQRRDVAAVIYNRLSDGMTLGIDATIRFATGNYTEPLTESELAIDSPYNTRLNAGLPPGPINSPGLQAIEAAARPSKKPYLFYVNEPGTCGRLAFSRTEEEFEADVARYHAARDAAGGNEPDTCEE